MNKTTEILKTAFNAVAPSRLYRRLFNPGDIITLNGSIKERTDVPRVSGDTLYSIESGTTIKIERFSRGYYKYSDPQNIAAAVFEHSKIHGTPHYEVRVISKRSLIDNFQKSYVPEGSLIHLPADIVDTRFRKV